MKGEGKVEKVSLCLACLHFFSTYMKANKVISGIVLSQLTLALYEGKGLPFLCNFNIGYTIFG